MTNAAHEARLAYYAPSTRLVLLYDAHCSLCRASLRFLERRDLRRRLRAVPLQDSAALAAFGLSEQEALGELHAFSRDGEHRRGADAVLWALFMLPRFGRLRLLLRVPGFLPVARFVYRQVAQRRLRDACDGERCRLH
jgi:predicted DCC family thiol-disulfide oxidoreductase YuxK